MPLPLSVPRDELHLRRIELRGFRRGDGLFDVEARMVDTKTHELPLADGRIVPAGEPVHDMSIRLVVDEALNVIDIVASTDASPFGICPEATTAPGAEGFADRCGLVDGHTTTACRSERLHASHRAAFTARHRRIPDAVAGAKGQAGPRRCGRQAPQDRQLLRVCKRSRSRPSAVADALRRPGSAVAREEGLIRPDDGARSDHLGR